MPILWDHMPELVFPPIGPGLTHQTWVEGTADQSSSRDLAVADDGLAEPMQVANGSEVLEPVQSAALRAIHD